MKTEILNQKQYEKLLKELENILETQKNQIENAVKTQTILTYWLIGKKITETKITSNANYYDLTIKDLEQDLNLNKSTLSRAVKFYEINPQKPAKENILSWSHQKHLIPIKDQDLRSELDQRAKQQNWSVKRLGQEINNLKENGWTLKNNESSDDLSNANSNSTNNTTPKNPKSINQQNANQLKRPTLPQYLYKAKIIDVVDGDTLILHIDLGFEVLKKQTSPTSSNQRTRNENRRWSKIFSISKEFGRKIGLGRCQNQ